MADSNIVQRAGRRLPTRGRKANPKSRAYEGADYQFTIAVAGQPVHFFTITKFPDPEQVGEWDDDHHEIYVKSPAPSAQAEIDRLLHEVVHAISSVAMGPEDRLTERQVNTLGLTLGDTLMRNPKLKEYLIGRLQYV